MKEVFVSENIIGLRRCRTGIGKANLGVRSISQISWEPIRMPFLDRRTKLCTVKPFATLYPSMRTWVTHVAIYDVQIWNKGRVSDGVRPHAALATLQISKSLDRTIPGHKCRQQPAERHPQINLYSCACYHRGAQNCPESFIGYSSPVSQTVLLSTFLVQNVNCEISLPRFLAPLWIQCLPNWFRPTHKGAWGAKWSGQSIGYFSPFRLIMPPNGNWTDDPTTHARGNTSLNGARSTKGRARKTSVVVREISMQTSADAHFLI